MTRWQLRSYLTQERGGFYCLGNSTVCFQKKKKEKKKKKREEEEEEKKKLFNQWQFSAILLSQKKLI